MNFAILGRVNGHFENLEKHLCFLKTKTNIDNIVSFGGYKNEGARFKELIEKYKLKTYLSKTLEDQELEPSIFLIKSLDTYYYSATFGNCFVLNEINSEEAEENPEELIAKIVKASTYSYTTTTGRLHQTPINMYCFNNPVLGLPKSQSPGLIGLNQVIQHSTCNTAVVCSGENLNNRPFKTKYSSYLHKYVQVQPLEKDFIVLGKRSYQQTNYEIKFVLKPFSSFSNPTDDQKIFLLNK